MRHRFQEEVGDPVLRVLPFFAGMIGASVGEFAGFWGVVAGAVAGVAFSMFSREIRAQYVGGAVRVVNLVDSIKNQAFAFFRIRA